MTAHDPVTSRRLGIPALLLAALALLGCEGKSPPAAATDSGTRYDSDYSAALGAANELCQAWRRRDLAAGRKLLSADMSERFTDEQLAAAIVGLSNPHHTSFEIFGGRRAGAGRYVFQVRLFHTYTGQVEDRIEAPVERIEVVLGPDGRWLVDDFPVPVRQMR